MTRKFWAGLDVGVESTSLCVINDAGEVLQNATCPSTLKNIHREIRWMKRRRFARVGLEAAGGATIARGLRSLGYAVDLYEGRQLSTFLRMRRNKTDAGDAIGIAEAGRIGASVVSKVYLKSLESQSLQSRLTIRRHIIRQRIATTNLLCRQLELFGGRVRGCTRSMQLHDKVEAEIRSLFGKTSTPLPTELRDLLQQCEQLILYQKAVDREFARLAFDNEVCRRFMEIPGVGPICALSFFAAVGEPDRFSRSANIGSYFGLTPKLHQSGLTVRSGRISKMGHAATRTALVHASVSFMRWSDADSELRNWTLRVEERRGRAKSRVALARKLATIMLAMWKSGENYKSNSVHPTSESHFRSAAESDPDAPQTHLSAEVVLGPILSNDTNEVSNEPTASDAPALA